MLKRLSYCHKENISQKFECFFHPKPKRGNLGVSWVQKLTLLTLVPLIVTGCTSANFLPADEARDATLHQCIHDASLARSKAASNDGGLLGGALFGAVGAVAGSALDQGTSGHLPDENRLIEACMAEHGYSGTASGWN